MLCAQGHDIDRTGANSGDCPRMRQVAGAVKSLLQTGGSQNLIYLRQVKVPYMAQCEIGAWIRSSEVTEPFGRTLEADKMIEGPIDANDTGVHLNRQGKITFGETIGKKHHLGGRAKSLGERANRFW